MNTQKAIYEKAEAVYLADVKHKNTSEKTVKNYTKVLKYFKEFLYSTPDADPVPAASNVREWRDSLLEKGLSPSTVKQYLVTLKTFFEFATDGDLLDDPFYTKNPVSKKMFPKASTEEKKPYEKILTNEDLKLLWVNDHPTKGKYWPRNYAIITLLLDGKIRNDELRELKLRDVDFDHKELTVRKGKGDKYRVVTLSDISCTAIKLYLKSGFRPEYCTEDDYLFGTTSAHAYGKSNKASTERWHKGTSAWLSGIVENHVKNVTGKEGFRSHAMRHNGAVIDLNTGSSLERIQSELGHASIVTTEIYAGRLQSTRHAREMEDVVSVRDEWAEKNAKALARKRNK